MNIQIKKIIIAAAALFFMSSGVSFAHEWDHRRPGKAYGHYKVKKHHHGWHKKHYKHWRHHRGYVYKEVHHHDHNYKNPRRRPARDQGSKMVFKIVLKGDEIF